ARVESTRHLARVTRRQDEMLATLARIGTGQAHVHYPAEVKVVGYPEQRSLRQLDGDGSAREVDRNRGIGRVGVWREQDVPGQTLKHNGRLIVLRSQRLEAGEQPVH